MNGKIGTFCLVLLVACCGCHGLPPGVEEIALPQKLKTVTVSDGVSQSEADIIARLYFARHVGCGGCTGVRDGGDRWIVDGKFGIAAAPITGFFIDKRTGKVTSPVGPGYENPLNIFQ
jgi:hypothetical protein